MCNSAAVHQKCHLPKNWSFPSQNSNHPPIASGLTTLTLTDFIYDFVHILSPALRETNSTNEVTRVPLKFEHL